MNKNVNCVFGVLALLFTLYSCEFSPSEIPLTELEEPSDNVPAVWIELTPGMDTLRLSAPIRITYFVETGEHQLYQIKVELDNVEIEHLGYESPKKINAHIPVTSMEDGLHEIKITTYTATNSGSIADKTGNEIYWYELTWPVFVNKQAKDNLGFSDLELVPEGLKLSWPQYRYADFEHYEFSWHAANTQDGRISITDPYQNSYIDNTYVEGCYVYYSLLIHYTEGGFAYDNKSYFEEIESPLVQVNEDCTVDIRWIHSKYEQNVQLYCIQTSVPSYGRKEEHDVTNLNDTTIRLNEKIGFGGDYQVRLRYIPKGYHNYHSALNTAGGVTTFAIGDSVPRFEEAFLISNENSLLLYHEGSVSKYNILTGESSQTISINPEGNAYTGMFNGSPDGNCFGYFENHDYVIRRSSDLSIVNKTDLEAFNGYNLELNSVAVSNNGLIATTGYFGAFRIFDSMTGQKIYEQQFDSRYYPRKVLFSPDGKNLAVMVNDYTLNTTSLIYYSFEGNELAELGRVDGVGQSVWDVLVFGPQDKQQLAVSRWRSMYEYNVEVMDSRTFELLYSVEIPFLFVPVAYDFISDQVIGRYQSFPTKDFSYVVDLKTGEQKQTVLFSGKEPLVFTDGIVYSGNGRSIAIDDFITE